VALSVTSAGELPSGEVPAVLPPGPGQVEAGIEAAEREELAREQELASPGAVEQRQMSRQAYADLSDVEARDLLPAAFPAQLARLNADPARFLSDVEIVRAFGESAATIREDGDSSLLEADVPLRAENEEGELEKVDLGLDATPSGLEPANPLTDLRIPAAADEPIAVGDRGLAISVLGADGTEARRLGDKNAFYPEVQPDTDLLVAPTAAGVELFDQLRSPASPEQLRFGLELPPGAELRPAGGGAVVVAGGEVLAAVPPPSAVDAQGTHVAVELRVEGDAVVLEVAHREADLAYPILVDPALSENYEGSWYWGGSAEALAAINTAGVWQYSTNDPTEKWILHSTSCLRAELCSPSGRGLFVSSVNGTMPANAYGQWYYTVPGSTTYIPSIYPEPSATINPFGRNNYNCGWEQYRHPHDYDGSFDAAGNWQWLETDRAQWYGNDIMFTKAKGVALGLSTGPGGSIPCWRNIMAGGVSIRLDDPEAPTLYGVTLPSSEEWLSPTHSTSVNVTAGDAGLGVRNIEVTPDAAKAVFNTNPQEECPGTKTHPCPAYLSASIPLSAGLFREGIRSAQVVAYDPTGKRSGTTSFTVRVDSSAPVIDLKGQFAEATDEVGTGEIPPSEEAPEESPEKLSLPVYNLAIKATDGSEASDETKGSGVKDIEVLLDGQKQSVPWGPLPNCPETSCSMTENFELKTVGLSTGEHTLTVRVPDFAGNVEEREIKFEYFPATGMREDYVLWHFPLAAGEEEEAHAPELAVNVVTGNLVYHERDVDIEGPGADLEVERFYNSQLPEAENTEWGDGWTLAQTPALEPLDTGGSPAPDEAGLLDQSGGLDGGVELPEETGSADFDPELGATLTKTAGGYELAEESGGAIAFDGSGRAEELVNSDLVSVDYDYEGGALSGIAVDDPGGTEASLAEAVQIEDEALEIEEAAGPATHLATVAPEGEEAERLDYATDMAIGAGGNIWVLDGGDPRIEKLSPSGEYLGGFGTPGSGSGQLYEPVALAIRNGNIWILDRGKNQVMRFTEAGKFLSAFGTSGTANGKFAAPEGIAITPAGKIWIADTGNERLQLFSEGGSFIKVVGQMQVGRPTAIDTRSNGDAWVVDAAGGRIVQVSENGQIVRWAGNEGEGELEDPTGIAVDSTNSVWVADRSSCRLEKFGPTGTFVSAFGSCGQGPRQFSFGGSTGLALDAAGELWLTDSENQRLQSWHSQAPDWEATLPVDDPEVDVELQGGLVSGLEGEQAGEHSYEHEGDLLTAHVGPEGEVPYGYDEAKRMTKVTLPDGTYGEIAYEEDYGRVESVTVALGGTDPKTTSFAYEDEPHRRTTVFPSDAPHVTYDIAPDGSVVRWWNAEASPQIQEPKGSLWVGKENPASPISIGDHWLNAEARSQEGVASIEFIVGDAQVSEKTCAQDPDPEIECKGLEDEWVVNTKNLTPGILPMEIVATDSIGRSASQRFWVNIPYTPPPDPGAEQKPEFDEIKEFRQRFGLDLDLDPIQDEVRLDERIFRLIGAWSNPQTPLGEVARASWERWGVPLRPVDVAELEYREWFYHVDAERIDRWVEEVHPSSYAGYYIDHAAGGIMHIGFTGGQAERLASLKASLSLVAGERLQPYPTTPAASYLSVQSASELVSNAIESNSTLGESVVSVKFDEAGKAVRVGTPSVAQVEGILGQMLGPGVPIAVEYEAREGSLLSGRFRNEGRMRAGDAIFTHHYTEGVHDGNEDCTAGFGAKDKAGESRGQVIWRLFILTAGHCNSELDKSIYRSTDSNSLNEEHWSEVGAVTRTGYRQPGSVDTDAEAVRVQDAGIVPQGIFGAGGNLEPTEPAAVARKGDVVCFSGAKTQAISCGQVVGRTSYWVGGFDGVARAGYWVKFSDHAIHGDSGAPVYSISGPSVGLVSAGRPSGSFTETLVEPLLTPFGMDPVRVPGILHDPYMQPLSLKLGK
jgi:streptogramin lyase